MFSTVGVPGVLITASDVAGRAAIVAHDGLGDAGAVALNGAGPLPIGTVLISAPLRC